MIIIKRDFSVAVKAVVIRDNQFLVLRRSKKEIESSYMNNHEKWDLPGGGIRYFEKAEDGLLREVMEETGLNVTIIKPISLFDAIKPHIHLCIFTYVCTYDSGEVQLSSEHDAYYWLTLEEAEEKELPRWMLRDFKSAATELCSFMQDRSE